MKPTIIISFIILTFSQFGCSKNISEACYQYGQRLPTTLWIYEFNKQNDSVLVLGRAYDQRNYFQTYFSPIKTDSGLMLKNRTSLTPSFNLIHNYPSEHLQFVFTNINNDTINRGLGTAILIINDTVTGLFQNGFVASMHPEFQHQNIDLRILFDNGLIIEQEDVQFGCFDFMVNNYQENSKKYHADLFIHGSRAIDFRDSTSLSNSHLEFIHQNLHFKRQEFVNKKRVSRLKEN